MKSRLISGSLAAALLVASPVATPSYAQNDPGSRAITGGLLGAGTGAALGAIAGGGSGAAKGAMIGGAIGAVGGVATAPRRPYYGYYGPRRYASYGGCAWVRGHYNRWGGWTPGHCAGYR